MEPTYPPGTHVKSSKYHTDVVGTPHLDGKKMYGIVTGSVWNRHEYRYDYAVRVYNKKHDQSQDFTYRGCDIKYAHDRKMREMLRRMTVKSKKYSDV